jgi:hypothetical protein
MRLKVLILIYLLLINSCASINKPHGFIDPEAPIKFSQKKIIVNNVYEYNEDYSIDKLHKEGRIWSKDLCGKNQKYEYQSCMSYVEIPETMIHVVRSNLLSRVGEWNYKKISTSLSPNKKNSQGIKVRTLEFEFLRKSCFVNIGNEEKFVISECTGE